MSIKKIHLNKIITIIIIKESKKKKKLDKPAQ